MKKKLIFLGIETSCDETAAAVIKENGDGTGQILSNIVSSQIEEHKEFGGIVPEVAARAHVEKIEFIKSVIAVPTNGVWPGVPGNPTAGKKYEDEKLLNKAINVFKI